MNQMEQRLHNNKRILEVILKYKNTNGIMNTYGVTRSTICKRTGLAWSTVFDYLKRDPIESLTNKYQSMFKTTGRPKVFYSIKYDKLKEVKELIK